MIRLNKGILLIAALSWPHSQAMAILIYSLVTGYQQRHLKENSMTSIVLAHIIEKICCPS